MDCIACFCLFNMDVWINAQTNQHENMWEDINEISV